MVHSLLKHESILTLYPKRVFKELNLTNFFIYKKCQKKEKHQMII